MRIVILGSVALPVPPLQQGGTEWIAYFQAKGLAELGHDVILIASIGSIKDGKYKLIEVGGGDAFKTSEKKNPFEEIEGSRPLRRENVHLAEVIQILMDRKDEYDLILNNMRGEAVFLPFAKAQGKPFANVMHLPIFPELAEAFKKYNTPVITISNNQRKQSQELNYLATVYNCVDTEKYLAPVGNQLGRDYLLMMGTIGRHKNQGAAIRVAKKLGMKLVLAGKIRDNDYYEELKKDIDGEKIKIMGQMDFQEKVKLYQNARAFIFPILWEEPFGLVLIEAMSCGTPVVAFKNGAIPEVVVDGKTGFIIENNNEEEMAKAISRIGEIKREDCRQHVMENFSVEKMVNGYEEALLKLVGNKV